MKNVLMNKATFTPILQGKELHPFTIDLLSCTGIKFKYDKGYTEMSAPGFKEDWIRLKETKEVVEAFFENRPKIYKIRGTDQIVREGNDDYNK